MSRSVLGVVVWPPEYPVAAPATVGAMVGWLCVLCLLLAMVAWSSRQ